MLRGWGVGADMTSTEAHSEPAGSQSATSAETAQDIDATVRRILTSSGDTWAVVGLSNNTARAAYGVAGVLRRFGKHVVPVHPKAETVYGEPGYTSLAEVPFPVDVVDVFVNSSLAGQVADEAVAAGAKAVWFQLDVVDEAARERTRAAGLDMVMDRCPAIEIPRLG